MRLLEAVESFFQNIPNAVSSLQEKRVPDTNIYWLGNFAYPFAPISETASTGSPDVVLVK